jgi:hypothetical protein
MTGRQVPKGVPKRFHVRSHVSARNLTLAYDLEKIGCNRNLSARGISSRLRNHNKCKPRESNIFSISIINTSWTIIVALESIDNEYYMKEDYM